MTYERFDVLFSLGQRRNRDRKSGDTVKPGDVLATIEAMKMEQEIKSDIKGEVKEIFINEGDSVATGDLLMQIL